MVYTRHAFSGLVSCTSNSLFSTLCSFFFFAITPSVSYKSEKTMINVTERAKITWKLAHVTGIEISV